MANNTTEQIPRLRQATAGSQYWAADAGEQRVEGGGQAIAAALAGLPRDAWKIFHDVAWPGHRTATIDHVLVGPGGVFVIESLSWSGNVEVAGRVLGQHGRSQEQAVARAADAGLAVAELLPDVDGRDVHPVLCFVRDREVTGWARDVVLCSTANLAGVITSCPDVLGPVDVRTTSLGLGAQFRCALATRPRPAAHVASVTAVVQRPITMRAKAKKQARDFLLGVTGMVGLMATATNSQLLSSAADLLR